MKIRCPKCGGMGNVDDARVPMGGATVRCPNCSERFPVSHESIAPTSDPSSGEFEAYSLDSYKREEPFTESRTFKGNPACLELCSICRKTLPRTDMIRFGDTWVCAHCKPSYLQMLQQGIHRPGEIRYAGFWVRLGAKFIDGLILWGIGFLVGLSVAMAGESGEGSEDLGCRILTIIAQIGIPLIYNAVSISKHQATPGKMACGLMVIMGDGSPVSGWRAVGRYFAEMVSSLVLCIGYIMIAFDREKRGLHDRICDTRVVYR